MHKFFKLINMNQKFKKSNLKTGNSKDGFTLSEVLITLGIIGVIAALTIPSIMKDYRNKLYVAQLKKTFVQIEDAMSNAVADEHATDFYETTSGSRNAAPSDDFPEGKGPYYFLNKYFKTIKTGCNSIEGDENQCYAPVYKPMNGADHDMTLFGQYCIQTTNGAAICMVKNDAAGGNNIHIAIDVNGPEDPNIAGRDAFVFSIDHGSTVLRDWSNNPDDCGVEASAFNHIADYSRGCVTKIIDAGWKMNY